MRSNNISPFLSRVKREDVIHVFQYIESRYSLEFEAFPQSMYESSIVSLRNRGKPPVQWTHDGSDIIVSLINPQEIGGLDESEARRGLSRHFFILITRSNAFRSANIIFMSRCFRSVFYSLGVSCSSEYFEDTLVEGHFEAPDVFSLSDIFIHKGSSLYNQNLCYTGRKHHAFFNMDSMSRVSLLRALAADLSSGHSTITFTVPIWYSNVDKMYRAIFSASNRIRPALPMHVVVRKEVRKCIMHMDKVVRIAITTPKEGTANDSPHDSPNVSHTDVPNISPPYAPTDATKDAPTDTNKDAPTDTNKDSLETCLIQSDEIVAKIKRTFFVRSTDLPDVYELYEHFASIRLGSPDAIAGILTLRDSHAMQRIFAQERRSAVIHHEFTFNSHVDKWVPVFDSSR